MVTNEQRIEQAASLSAAMERIKELEREGEIDRAFRVYAYKEQQQRVVVLEEAIGSLLWVLNNVHNRDTIEWKALYKAAEKVARAALAGTQRLDSDPIQERNRELAKSHGARIPSPFESTAGGTQTGETR